MPIITGDSVPAPSTGMPAISVEISLTDPYATPAWIDITRYVESFNTTMGRQHELQQVQPSTATIVLSNEPTSHSDTTGGRFSPWNTGGTYALGDYGAPLYGFGPYGGAFSTTAGGGIARPVRITATWSAITYPIFYGYTKSWVPSYSQTRSTVTLSCVDILALLNLNTLDTGQYRTTVLSHSPTAYWTFGDPIGSTLVADSSGNGHTGWLNGGLAFGAQSPLLTESVTAAAGPGMMQTSVNSPGSGTIMAEGWFKTTGSDESLLDFPASQSAGTFYTTTVGVSSGGNATIQYGHGFPGQLPTSFGTFCSGPIINDGRWHHIAAEVPCGSSGASWKLYVDGVLTGTSGAPGAYTFGNSGSWPISVAGNAWGGVIFGALYYNYLPNFSGSVGQVAYYTTPLTAAQVLADYQIGSATWLVQDSGARINAVLKVAGVPSGLTNVGAGLIQCQGATSALTTTTAMSYLNTIVNTERGFMYQDTSGVIQYRNRHYVYETAAATTSQGTFGYSGTDLKFYDHGIVPVLDDLDLWNNVNVQRVGGTIQNAADLVSQGHHGRRSLTGYTNLLFTNDSDSVELAQGLMHQYSSPAARVRALTTDNTIAAGAAMPQMLGRQLLDRITINWRPLDGSSADFSQQSLIEQISHSVDASTGVWSTTFAVTPIGTEHFGIYGTDVYGTAIYGF
jgi:hypothetical protein